MSHMIEKTDGIATGRGIVPWHGLGVTLPGLMTPAMAIEKAGLDWTVSLQPLMCKNPDFSGLSVDRNAVVRMDTHEVLGTVGNSYKIVQNIELAAVLDAAVENGARIDTAGSLMGGRLVWFAAVMGEDYEAAGDQHRDFLVISHGHDGNRALQIRRTTVRVVCWNTLTASDADKAATYFSIRHTNSAPERLAVVGKLIGNSKENRVAFQQAAKRLAGKKFSEKEQFDFILKSLNLDPTIEIASMQRKIEAAKAALLWEREMASGNPNSLWTAVQGATHFAAHEEASKGSTSIDGRERRLASVLDGDRAKLTTSVFNAALQLI